MTGIVEQLRALAARWQAVRDAPDTLEAIWDETGNADPWSYEEAAGFAAGLEHCAAQLRAAISGEGGTS